MKNTIEHFILYVNKKITQYIAIGYDFLLEADTEKLRAVDGFRHTKNNRKKKKWQDFEAKRLSKKRLLLRLMENVQMQGCRNPEE